ncbi:hypothetical protein HOT99_gp334 [Caulobacter phage CcrBL10]|uniref:Uncharacterized protein n=1 Tax=Caulobacter phage CcrBL10 TaxID=2283269 RepID=A0A385E8Z9_9CAUD|nr:hypothetical protein HOT99_gp334 [Caulobacter phage CcrBL10]AXQ68283.1 hypothetical protein CcrBL10_gp079 [Caulobacter phage CcrBL10]
MHMRTREDMAEVKEKVKTIASSQERFERDVWREMDIRHTETKQALADIKDHTNERISEIESKVNTIREERIAEKAQWRGPEKVIAAIVALAGGVTAIGVLWSIFKPH